LIKTLAAAAALVVLSCSASASKLILRAEIGSTFPVYPAGSPTALEYAAETRDTYAAWDGLEFTAPHAGTFRFHLRVWVEDVAGLPAFVGALLWQRSTGLPIGWDGRWVTAVPPAQNVAAVLSVSRSVELAQGDVIYPTLICSEDATVAHPPWESWLEVEELD
jgi:hypothetical protein